MSAQQLGEQYPSAVPDGEDAKGVVRITPSDPRFQSKAAAAIAPEAPTRPRLRPSQGLRALGDELSSDDQAGSDGDSWRGSKKHRVLPESPTEPRPGPVLADVVDEDDDREDGATAVHLDGGVNGRLRVSLHKDEDSATDLAADPADDQAAGEQADERADARADEQADAQTDDRADDDADQADQDDDPADNGLGTPDADGNGDVRRDEDAADNGLGVPIWGDDLPPGSRRGYDSPEIAAARTGRVTATAAVPDSSRAKPETAPAIPGPRTSPEGGGRPRRRSTMFALVAIAFVLVSNAFLAQPFSIPSGSMEQTMVEGDKVLTEKISPWYEEPKRGEIIVFRGQDSWADDEYPTGVVGLGSDLLWRIGVTPPGQKNVIKRVVGLPGDQVACCDAEGHITVNGVSIDEKYIYRDSELVDRQFGPITVPDGRLFVMGDHRSDSGDSRAHLDDGVSGTIAMDAVIGRAVAVVWPLSHWRSLGDTELFADVPDPTSSAAARDAKAKGE